MPTTSQRTSKRRSNKLSASHAAQHYFDGVLDGSILVGKYVRLFVERHVRDLDRSFSDPEYKFYFDPRAGQRVIEFFSFLKPSKWEGDECLKLMPWQQAFLMVLFGWKKRATGYRRFTTAWLEISRKQGKSALGSGVGLYMLTADGEKGAEVYSAAIDKGQARRVFDEAVAMRDASSDLKKLVGKAGQTPTQNLHILKTASIFQPLSRDERKQEGLNIHAAVCDEIHKWKDRNMWDVIRYGMRSRKQPLLFQITTAGSAADHESICYSQHDYGVKVLTGIYEDDAFCPFIASIDEDDSYEDESCWPKACPSLGVTVQLEAMRQEFLEARNSPAAMNAFKRYSLNIWVESVDAAIEISEWDACKGDKLPDLAGRDCFAGLDLAMTRDLSALGLWFPPTVTDPKHYIQVFYWIPENNIEERCKRDHVQYDLWRDQKLLITTPGDTTDFDFIRDKILDLSQTYNMRELAYDPALATPLINSLMAAGYPAEKLVKFSQTAMNYAAPCNEWLRKILRREMAHDGNSILRWNVSNLVWRTNSTGLIQPDKDRAPERIDGAVAMIMALGRATSPENVTVLPQIFVL